MSYLRLHWSLIRIDWSFEEETGGRYQSPEIVRDIPSSWYLLGGVKSNPFYCAASHRMVTVQIRMPMYRSISAPTLSRCTDAMTLGVERCTQYVVTCSVLIGWMYWLDFSSISVLCSCVLFTRISCCGLTHASQDIRATQAIIVNGGSFSFSLLASSSAECRWNTVGEAIIRSHIARTGLA